MSDKLSFNIKSSTGCCKTVNTVIDTDGQQELVTIDMSTGKITYGAHDKDDAQMLCRAKAKKNGEDPESCELPDNDPAK